jgi:hypothetical protein
VPLCLLEHNPVGGSAFPPSSSSLSLQQLIAKIERPGSGGGGGAGSRSRPGSNSSSSGSSMGVPLRFRSRGRGGQGGQSFLKPDLGKLRAVGISN